MLKQRSNQKLLKLALFVMGEDDIDGAARSPRSSTCQYIGNKPTRDRHRGPLTSEMTWITRGTPGWGVGGGGGGGELVRILITVPSSPSK